MSKVGTLERDLLMFSCGTCLFLCWCVCNFVRFEFRTPPSKVTYQNRTEQNTQAHTKHYHPTSAHTQGIDVRAGLVCVLQASLESAGLTSSRHAPTQQLQTEQNTQRPRTSKQAMAKNNSLWSLLVLILLIIADVIAVINVRVLTWALSGARGNSRSRRPLSPPPPPNTHTGLAQQRQHPHEGALDAADLLFAGGWPTCVVPPRPPRWARCAGGRDGPDGPVARVRASREGGWREGKGRERRGGRVEGRYHDTNWIDNSSTCMSDKKNRAKGDAAGGWASGAGGKQNQGDMGKRGHSPNSKVNNGNSARALPSSVCCAFAFYFVSLCINF
jgi:hypothetical protein